MYNFRSPIMQEQYGYLMNQNPYYYQQQLNYQQGNYQQQYYYQQPNYQQQQPYYYTAPGYNQYQQYNPYLINQRMEEERKRQFEEYKFQIDMQRHLEELSLKYLGLEVNKEYLDAKYNLNPQKNQPQPQELKKKINFTISCYRGEEEVYTGSDDNFDLGDAYDDTLYNGGYYNMTKPTVAYVRQLEMAQQYSANYINPNYVKALNKIEEDRNKLVDPNSDIVDFFNNAYKLYIEALEMDAMKQQNQLNTLFDPDKYRNSLYSGSIDFNKVFNSTNLDDHVIGLPDKLKTEYSARKRAFIEKCMQRSSGGA